MKCKKCSSEAIIHLKQHNIALCPEHYEEFFYSRVKKAIKRYRMFGPDWKILVAVSGGKDSLVLWEVLNNLGYEADGLYIDLGIGKYSETSKTKAVSFAEKRGLKLFISSVRDYLGGLSTPEAAKIMRRKTCSICGLVKRYIMNRFSHESGYDVIATGHNLDDEAATLFGNLTHWQLGYLEKQYPVLPKTHPKLTPKVKPLILLTEREVATFALMKSIDYIMVECPASKGASSMLYKELLNILEVNQPGTKHRFLTEYFKVKDIFSGQEGKIELKECSICGYPTTQDICSFCKLQEGINKRINEKGR
ncbi:MAG: TIGR00269 family protein [Thermotogae bacterium]|uniref:TIGR00269 family protein n=1 Tax=Kosmotoga arenicorallina TaxID=688066 RepID=A0A7C5E036_9BACT|nr:TIGR00269 family protein [Kosmotoga sp.]MBO8165909.1 TIGR00269 family protein [Kosmotoga sp.]RKX50357.1 MAG: TIGR00269 family protein [Thermotogota bacterium]HHF08863.1 TIGR00269 family protein [Kosmotoga arenicorallina]